MYCELRYFGEGLKILDFLLYFINGGVDLVQFDELEQSIADGTFEEYVQNHESWNIIILEIIIRNNKEYI